MGFAVGINNVGRGHFLFKHNGSIPSKVNALAKGSKKVIAITDEWLGTDNGMKGANVMFNKFPQIHESFIKDYVEAQGKIEEVLVEYEESDDSSLDFGGIYIPSRIKTRSDNTIIIHEAKTYTREELRELLIVFGNYPVNRNSQQWVDYWMQINL